MKKGKIFSIEEFSTYDGPGIRMTIFLKGCPLSCLWCHNPEGQNFESEYIKSPNGCLSCNKCLECAIKKDDRYILTKESEIVCPRKLIRLCGEDYTPNELVEIISKNIDVLKMNNGGVTFSGGEPTSQYKFLLECLKLLKGKVHIALQTCGYIANDKFKELLKYVDYVLYDLKIINNEEHKKFVGVDNALILENYLTLINSNVEYITRIPLIPYVIANKNNISNIIDLLKEHKISKVELLPYNEYAGSKYSWLLREYKFDFKATLSNEEILKMFIDNDIEGKVL